VRWPASIFPSSHFTFSSSKKLNFLIQSNIRQVSNILVFLNSCTRPTSFAWLSGRTLSLLQLECSREEECLVRAKNFSAHNPQLFSFSSLLTEVPKNRSHPRLIQEYFSCRSSSSSDDARQSYWIVLLWTFSSSSHRAKVLAAISITRQDEAMSSSWGLRRKSLTVIIILGGRLERRKELVDRFESSLRWRDGSQRWWERTFDWIVRLLSSGRFAWNPETQNLSFSKKFVRRFRKLFSTTLYLFFRGWWQIFVLLNARSQLLEVIFLLVQAEAQYNSDTINNISTVSVVKWGSSIFVLWCRKSWRASVTSESRTSSSPTRVRWIFSDLFIKRRCSSGH